MFRRHVEWWYWLVTVASLSAGLAGYPEALALAVALTVVQVLRFVVHTGGLTSFSVQVRVAYLTLLLLGFWPALSFVHWIQFAGTWAMVVADYCFLARCLSLLPWNRREPLTAQHVASTFLSRPVKGNILQGLPPDDRIPAGTQRSLLKPSR
jgi:hypothetical protein